jgi:transposase
MPFACVQPLVESWSRRAEDLTIDKTDDKDAVLIAMRPSWGDGSGA